jgi:hypothetical protein
MKNHGESGRRSPGRDKTDCSFLVARMPAPAASLRQTHSSRARVCLPALSLVVIDAGREVQPNDRVSRAMLLSLRLGREICERCIGRKGVPDTW